MLYLCRSRVVAEFGDRFFRHKDKQFLIMDKTISKTGTTTPAKVKKMLRRLADNISTSSAIVGGMERTSNEINYHFVIDGISLSINIQSME